MEIRSPRCQPAQNWTLSAIHIDTLARDQRLTGVRRVEGHHDRGILRVRASGNLVHREVRRAEFCQAGDDGGIGLESHLAAGGDIERKRQRVIADVRCIVTGRARALDYSGTAERWIVVEPANIGDGGNRSIE